MSTPIGSTGAAPARAGQVELAITYRCRACGNGHQELRILAVPAFPGGLDAKLPLNLPDGWVAESGHTYCPSHPPAPASRIVPVHTLPAGLPRLKG